MGNETSKSDDDKQARAVASVGIGAGLVVLSVVCPPAGAVASATYSGTGFGMKMVGRITDNEELEKAGEVLEDGGILGGFGSGVSGVIQGKKHACSTCKIIKKALAW